MNDDLLVYDLNAVLQGVTATASHGLLERARDEAKRLQAKQSIEQSRQRGCSI